MQRFISLYCLFKSKLVMKKTFVCLATMLFAITTFAQSDTVRLRDISKQQKDIVTDRPPQAVYLNLGGASPLIGVFYDRRFANRVNGFGFSTGLGYWGSSDGSVFSIPLSFNYLFGKQTHFIEMAAGTTYVTSSEDFFDTDESGFIHHINLGYRHQPTRGGFFFRGGYSPLFFGGEYGTSFYLGFGHNF